MRAGWWLSLELLKPQLIVFPMPVIVLWRCWRTLVGLSIALAVTLALSIGAAGFWIPRSARFLADANRPGAQFSNYPVAMQNRRGLLYSLLSTTVIGRARGSAGAYHRLGLAVLCRCDPRSAQRSGNSNEGVSGGRYGDAVYATAVLLGCRPRLTSTCTPG